MGAEKRCESFLLRDAIVCQTWFNSQGGLSGSILTQEHLCTAATGLNTSPFALTTRHQPPLVLCLISAVRKISVQSFGESPPFRCCPPCFAHIQPTKQSLPHQIALVAFPLSRSSNHHKCDTGQLGTQPNAHPQVQNSFTSLDSFAQNNHQGRGQHP